jgi:hypothetical protein
VENVDMPDRAGREMDLPRVLEPREQLHVVVGFLRHAVSFGVDPEHLTTWPLPFVAADLYSPVMETATVEKTKRASNSDDPLRVVFVKLSVYPDKHRLLDLYRARVPGGWLVVYGPERGGAAFLPDPQHSWLVTGGEAYPLFPPSPPGGTIPPKE